MAVTLAGIGCVTPPGRIRQDRMAELSRRYNAATPVERALIDRIYRGTRVDQRATVLGERAAMTKGTHRMARPAALNGRSSTSPCSAVVELDDTATFEALIDFYPDPGHALGVPNTAERMRVYEKLVLPLAADACRAALSEARIDPAQITQIVTVSCTGFAAPGLDVRLIQTLGLAPTVGRTAVGFMGCHGAINGLRVAGALAAADRQANVLLVCAELCTLHFQYGHDPSLAVANALFGDGAGAIVLQGDKAASNIPADDSLKLLGCGSVVLPDTAEHMSWRIGDTGFAMTLSPEVPAQIERHARPFAAGWLAQYGLTIDTVGGWVIHPGGPKVITAVERGLGLPDRAGDVSRAILAEHGNMSSSTVLFIAERMRAIGTPPPWVMLAFGPGLVVEAALLG